MAEGAAYLAAAVVAAYAGYEASSRQSERVIKAQEELSDKETAIAGEEAARSRRQQIQRALVAQAEVTNIAEGSGVAGSSAPTVSSQAVSGQAAQNIGSVNAQLAKQGVLARGQEKVFEAGRPTAGEAITTSVAGSMSKQFAGAAGQQIGQSVGSLFEEKE